MDSKLLMIGDWVYDKVLKSNARVEALQPLTIKCDIHTLKHMSDEFEPIPLTSLILEKNGWIQCKYETCKSLYEYKGSHLRHAMIKRSNGRWVANVDGIAEKFSDEYAHSPLRINVFYVHELQHALRLCGLDELASNFKID